MTKTLGDLLKDVKKSIINEVDKKDPVVSLDKNNDGLVITKSSGKQFTIDLSHFNADMANIAKGEKGDTGERGERGLSIKGDRGEPGRDGNSIVDVRFDQRGHLIIETDDKTYDLGLLRSGGGTTTIVQQGGNGEVNLTGDVSGTTNANGVTNTLLQPSDHVFEIISRAPTYEYPEFTEFNIAFPESKYEIGDSIPDGNYGMEIHINNLKNFAGTNNMILRDTNDSFLEIYEFNFSGLYTFESFNYDFSLDDPGYYNFKINGQNTKGENFNKLFSVPFVDRYYYGESNQDTMIPPAITSFDSKLSEVERPKYTDFLFEAGNRLYKWVYIPERFGNNYFFEDPTTGIQFLMEESNNIDITNDYGVTSTYKTYRSVNAISAPITLRVY